MGRAEEHRKYLKSKAWQRKRLQALAHHGCECAACGAKEKIHIHHISYLNLNRKGPGKESMEDLIPLCEYHHMLVHALIDQYKNKFYSKRPGYNFEKASKDAIKALIPQKYLTAKAKKDKAIKRPKPKRKKRTKKKT
jgi:5-methylcytosine-specific restriction endonuclease McrA|tara:strand:- start:474 stop:884 length:411 start_codon:yes stop_codon:yes gene_type:complete